MSARFYIKDVYRLSQPEAFQSLDCVVAKAVVLIGLFGDQWLHFLDGDEELCLSGGSVIAPPYL